MLRSLSVPALAAAAALAAASPAAGSGDRTPPRISGVSVSSGVRFAGDRRDLATISPNGDGLRDRAAITFRLSERARVRLVVARTVTAPIPVYVRDGVFGRGRHTLHWAPRAANPRTYVVRLTARDAAGNHASYGPSTSTEAAAAQSAVIRVLGIDAAFDRASYRARDVARLRVETDERALTMQLFQAGPERTRTTADTVLNGIAAGPPRELTWRRRGPHAFSFRLPELASGIYYAQLSAADGTVGYAPFVVRPARLGERRVALVMPTYTWQAYNFRDENGDGWGDTWYAGAPNRTARLGRAFLRRGVPPHFRKYELGFLHWLWWTGKGSAVDVLADSDLERIGGDTLARAYDLVVFPGHTEYATARVYDAVERYRDRGGNLLFLAANNFFWQVRRTGGLIQRTRKWRDVGRPEAALMGVQYRGNDDGTLQGVFLVRGAVQAPWLFAGTGLVNGSLLGETVGGFGIEIDGTTRDSPPGTIVLAEIPDLYGPGYTAQMTYYETPRGAKVFAAGAMNVGGRATTWPLRQLLENLWARLAAP